MKKLAIYILLVWVFYGCSGTTSKNKNAIAVDTGQLSKTDRKSTDTATNENFIQFWEQFKLAVKKKDTAAINKLTYFPIGGVSSCYLPEKRTDANALSQVEFDKLNRKVFDDETSWLTTTPADSLYLYENNKDEKHLPLQSIADKDTPVYQYGVAYAQGNRGGDKNLYFGSVKGAYKLIWIDCDGDVTGHSH